MSEFYAFFRTLLSKKHIGQYINEIMPRRKQTTINLKKLECYPTLIENN
jgi:hypothetical protein